MLKQAPSLAVFASITCLLDSVTRVFADAGLQVSGDLVASVQSFAAFLQQQVGPAGPQVATATWDVNARRDVATGVKGLSDSNVTIFLGVTLISCFFIVALKALAFYVI